MISYRLSVGASLVFASALTLAPFFASAAQLNISIVSNSFSSPNIVINQGDTVVWRNMDGVAHTVTANDSSFDSGTIQPGANYSRTFAAPGTYPYHCMFHPGMTGTVTVVAPSAVYTSPPTYTPASISPSNADQLRAQAQALLARIQQLQAQLGTGGGTPAPNVVLDSSTCPLIGRSLKRGATGDDVTRLQQFLARDISIYPEGQVTGYYGALTQAAVQRWQVKYNIVSSGTPDTTGYGVVGPRTAAAIALLCTTGSYGGIPGPAPAAASVGGFIQVTPVVGNAPLSIAVQATVNTVNACAGAIYTLDYGDGSIPSQIAVPAGNCQQMVETFGHRYQYGGSYLITLSAGAHRTSATVQAYGAGPPAPAPTPTPNPAPSPTPTPPPATWGIVSVTPAVGGDPFTVSAQIEYSACAAYSIDWGDGTIPASVASQSGCSGGAASATLSHTYSGNGNYTISLRDGSGTVKATSGVTII